MFGFAAARRFVHSWLTRLQQERFGASVVSFPCPVLKTAHRATRGRVWFSPFFPPALLLWQSCHISFQFVVYCLLDRTDCVKKIPVPHQASFSSHLRGFRVDQSLLFQLPYVLGNRVGTHACMLADLPYTRPVLVGFPVLAEHQVGVNRQLARV